MIGHERWGSPPPRLPAVERAAHVWLASLDQPDGIARRLSGLCCPDEHRRASRYHSARDGKRFLVGRGVLRVILAEYLDMEPQSLEFGYGLYGKPFLRTTTSGSDIQFNIAHSESVMVCVVARGIGVGIDVERVRELPDWHNLLGITLSAREQRVVGSLAPMHRMRAFFERWVCKEAVLKARGIGLSGSLTEIETCLTLVDESQPRTASARCASDEAPWTLIQWSPAAGYLAALASQARNLSVACWEWSPSRLTGERPAL
jgi:4'-phosphopantetheinyl transferase